MDQAMELRHAIKLQNQNQLNTARIITITSGKGGVGKSITAVNLAVQFRKMGKRVVIFDADFGLANVEVMLGVIPKYNLSDLLYNGMSLRDILETGPMDIQIVSGGSGILGLNNLSSEQLSYLVSSLSELNDIADVILIDTGAGISDQVLEFVVSSPEILLVTTPDPSSLTDAYSLLKSLYRRNGFSTQGSSLNLIANKCISEEEGNALFEKLNAVVAQFLKGKLEYMGVVPQDRALESAVRVQKIVSLHDTSAKSARAYERIAESLLGEDEGRTQVKWGISQMLRNFLHSR